MKLRWVIAQTIVTPVKASFKEAMSICLCHTGLMPSPDIMVKDIPDLVPDEDNEDDKPYTGDDALEEGD